MSIDNLTYEQKLETAKIIAKTPKYKLPYVLQVLGVTVSNTVSGCTQYDLDEVYELIVESGKSFIDGNMLYIKNKDFYNLMDRKRMDPRRVLRALKDNDMIRTYETDLHRYAITKRHNGKRIKTIAVYRKYDKK